MASKAAGGDQVGKQTTTWERKRIEDETWIGRLTHLSGGGMDPPAVLPPAGQSLQHETHASGFLPRPGSSQCRSPASVLIMPTKDSLLNFYRQAIEKVH